MGLSVYGRTEFSAAAISMYSAATNYRLNGGATAVVAFATASCNGLNKTQIGDKLTADYANATSSRITVNAPGYYRIHAHGSYNGGLKTKATSFSLYRNGAAMTNDAGTAAPTISSTVTTDTGDSTDSGNFAIETIRWLEAGDYIQLYFLGVASGDGYLTDCDLLVHEI